MTGSFLVLPLSEHPNPLQLNGPQTPFGAILCLANRTAATAAAAQVNISGFTNYVGFVFVNLERVACWETEQHFIFKQKHGLAAVWC